jgi:hypothetical protein
MKTINWSKVLLSVAIFFFAIAGLYVILEHRKAIQKYDEKLYELQRNYSDSLLQNQKDFNDSLVSKYDDLIIENKDTIINRVTLKYETIYKTIYSNPITADVEYFNTWASDGYSGL